jgi:hypothetical protein
MTSLGEDANLCWLLRTFVLKIGDVRQDHLSHFSSCHHEKRLLPRRSSTRIHLSQQSNREMMHFLHLQKENRVGNAPTPLHLDTTIP